MMIVDYYNFQNFHEILESFARDLTKKSEILEPQAYCKLLSPDYPHTPIVYLLGLDEDFNFYLDILEQNSASSSSNLNHLVRLSTTEPDDFMKIVRAINKPPKRDRD